jgi:LPXTG-motif cell wall-anchored protein
MASPSSLAVTGSDSKPLGWIGFGLVFLGLALWVLAVRLRTE